MKVNNPRHPHKCRIYRVVGGTSFKDGDTIVLYEGACRKETSLNLRTFATDGVLKSDYLLSIPGTVDGIRSGDCIDVTDRTGTYNKCIVTDSYAGNLGTNVYFNVQKN